MTLLALMALVKVPGVWQALVTPVAVVALLARVTL